MGLGLTIGSLFSGIGGLDLGLELAGVGRTVWQVEINEFAMSVLEKRWPETEKFRDVRQVGFHNLKETDVICGGFPCQDISNAGRKAGIAGNSSGLWREYARVIDELRPKFVVIENVGALRQRGLSLVLCNLASLGYDSWWCTIRCSELGAAHQRSRLFILAHSNSVRLVEQNGGTPNFGGRVRECSDTSGGTVPIKPFLGRSFDESPYRLDRFVNTRDSNRDSWEPPRGSWKTPNRGERLKALGNSVSPLQSFAIGKVLVRLISEGCCDGAW